MSVLLDKQMKFITDFAKLINFAIEKGYELTFHPEHECHITNSLHYKGLAKDINLFKNGEYLTRTRDYNELGMFWEKLGNTWGGRFNDGCHFSIEHEGIK